MVPSGFLQFTVQTRGRQQPTLRVKLRSSTTLTERFFHLFQLRRAQQVRVSIHGPGPVAAFCASAWVSGSLARSCVSFLSAAWIAATSRGLTDTRASEPRLAPAAGYLLDRGLDFWVASSEKMGLYPPQSVLT